jgi:hypothetical protein
MGKVGGYDFQAVTASVESAGKWFGGELMESWIGYGYGHMKTGGMRVAQS